MTRSQRAARIYRLTAIAQRVADRIAAQAKSGRRTRHLADRLWALQRERMRTATGPLVRRTFAPTEELEGPRLMGRG